MPSNDHAVEYSVVAPEQRAAALAMLVSREPLGDQPSRIAQVVATLREPNGSADTLVGAIRDGNLVGVAWGQLMPGRTALIWPPRLVRGEDDSTSDKLVKLLDQQLQQQQIQMAQSVLPNADNADAKRLAHAGYEHVAELLYLISDLDRLDSTTNHNELEFEPYKLDEHQRMTEIIERTYINTQDIPALDGVRSLDDVLDGYQRTGVFSPDRWFFIRHDSSDVGCLLLTDHPQQDQWELVYVGITPEARGNRFGLLATSFAQHQTKQAGRRKLILAVDAANDPAVNAYTKAGFVELLRRSIFLKVFATHAE